MADLDSAAARRFAAADREYRGALSGVGAGWATHCVCEAVEFVHLQRGWRRFARAHYRGRGSFCAAIFSRWQAFALHHTKHGAAYVFTLGGFSRRQEFASRIARLEQACARIWRGLDGEWRIFSVRIDSRTHAKHLGASRAWVVLWQKRSSSAGGVLPWPNRVRQSGCCSDAAHGGTAHVQQSDAQPRWQEVVRDRPATAV